MGSAISSALQQLDAVGKDGDLAASASAEVSFDADTVGEPVVLPDGKTVYPPTIHGEPLHEIAANLTDLEDPSQSRFMRLTGLPGVGKTMLLRAVAYTLWSRRGLAVETRGVTHFYGFSEVQLGPGSDELSLRQEFVPVDGGQVRLVDSGFLRAFRLGYFVVLDEVNIAPEPALISINGAISQLALYLPSTGESLTAAPGFACAVSFNPQVTAAGGTDLPEAWYSRFPAAIEVTSNWAALVKIGVPEQLVAAAARLDQMRLAGEDGLTWCPQYRELESLHHLTGRVGERMAVSLFASDLCERTVGGRIQEAEAAAACRMLDEAGYGRLKVGASSRIANLHGYPRAVTR